MRIAFFTLLSPNQSALADYGEGLALAMSSLPGVTMDLFINDDYQPDNPVIVERFKIYTYHEFESRARDYDICFYSMGDHILYNGYMIDFIYRYPGVVILHDLTFQHCFMARTLGCGDVQAYLDEMNYAYGIQDLHVAQQMQAGLGDHLMLDFPLFERLVDSSRGVVVHNEYARGRILASRPQALVRRIPHPYFMPPGMPVLDIAAERVRQRAELGVQDGLVIGSFGLFVPNKHVEGCLGAFANVAQRFPTSRYILGGPVIAGYDLADRIRKMGLERQVILTGWKPPAEFVRMMMALDIGIHLRYPHIGGTPYTPIRLMGLEICTIVSDIEPLAEVPQGACIKIAPDDYQENTLTTVLNYLAEQPDLRQQVARNGRRFIAEQHQLEQVAQAYVNFLRQAADARG